METLLPASSLSKARNGYPRDRITLKLTWRATMIWAKRILLTLPFAVASVLTVLVSFANRLHIRPQRAAGYGFLFATPWEWLITRLWVPNFHTG